VTYLGHIVGQGNVKQLNAKIEGIQAFPVPKDRKAIQRFLGIAGFYRKFYKIFSSIAQPLTNLLQKNVKFCWTDTCQESFEKFKSLLISHPILAAPNFEKTFKLMVDASAVGIEPVLIQ